MDKKDIHHSWKLGSFIISGYSDEQKDENGDMVFLKTVGDEIALRFNLEQDINKLNNNEALSITADKHYNTSVLYPIL